MYLSNILVFFQNCYIIFERIKTIKKTKFWNFIQSLENVIQKWEPYPISYQMLKNPWTNFLKRDQNLFLQTWKNQIKNKNLWLVLVQIATTIRHCYKVRRHQFLILSLIHTIKFCPCLNPTITTMKIIIIFTIPSWHKAGNALGIWICGCSLYLQTYSSGPQNQRVHIVCTKSLKIRGCKRWCLCGFVNPLHPF